MKQGDCDEDSEVRQTPGPSRELTFIREEDPAGWCSLCSKPSAVGARTVQQPAGNYWWRFCVRCVTSMASALGVNAQAPAERPTDPAPPKPSSGRAPVVHEIPDGAESRPCQSCGAPIVFVRLNPKGKPSPIDADGPTRGQSHFATCPQANNWRGRTRAEGGAKP